jgi:hypothetical protein
MKTALFEIHYVWCLLPPLEMWVQRAAMSVWSSTLGLNFDLAHSLLSMLLGEGGWEKNLTIDSAM